MRPRDYLVKGSRDLVDGWCPPPYYVLHPTKFYDFAKFGGRRYCESADISRHLSRDHVIKRTRDFEVGVPPLQVTTLPSLVAIGIAEVLI